MKLIDKSLLGFELVIHVLHQLLSIVFPGSAILCRRKETAEIKRLFPNFSDGQVGTLKDGLESLEQLLGLVSSFLDVLLKSLELSVSNFVLVLRSQLDEPVGLLLLLLGSLALDLFHLFFELSLVLCSSEDVRLEQLVLSFDLLVIFLNGLKSLRQLL